jgi:hypothetical protein
MEMSNSTESSNTSVPTTIATPKFGIDFVPQTEDELLNYLKVLRAKESQGGICSKWHLGNFIRGFYKVENGYGTDKLGKIAKKSGWSKSTLQKSCQFAEKYTNEQVEFLFEGSFQLSWRDVSQNLCIEPKGFIDVYSRAQTSKEFRNSVIQLRQPLQGGTLPPKPKTRKELERELAERDQKIADLENQIQALEVKVESLTSVDHLTEEEEIENKADQVQMSDRPGRLEENLEKLVAAA